MTGDWYDEAKLAMFDDLMSATGVAEADARSVYDWLSSAGFIDYDIEKEILLDAYSDEADEDE